MGSVPPELSLDFGPTFVPKTIGGFLKELSMIRNGSEKVTKLDDFGKRLEEEMRKIDAFKRELPLCMLLLHDAILALKDESLQFKEASKAESKPKPVLEELIPLKDSENEGIKKDKRQWMSTFQLYDYQSIETPKHIEPKRNEEVSNKTTIQVEAFQIQNHNKRTVWGRAFLPYSGFPIVRKEEREELPVPGLSFLMPGITNLKEGSGSRLSKASCSRAGSSSAANVSSSSHMGRKQRRCWSPELHRRFLTALQELGGSQDLRFSDMSLLGSFAAATPKQIRELMNIDGLTNDEVKSHLQKYRLHTRKSSRSSGANQSIVLGSLWMPQDHCGESSKANSSQYGSPQGPFQLGAPGSTTGGDDDDDDEDEDEHEKSESYSWKGHNKK